MRKTEQIVNRFDLMLNFDQIGGEDNYDNQKRAL